MVHAISEHPDIKAFYLGMPHRIFRISEYMATPGGLVTDPVNTELKTAIVEKSFKAE